MNNAPMMCYSTMKRYIYNGSNKISAIKAVRAFTGLDLRSAKELVEWRGGFMCPSTLMEKIEIEYNSNLFAVGVGLSYNDWKVLEELPEPISLF